MAAPVIHTITHWVKQPPNEYNENSFAEPVEVIAFWIDNVMRMEDMHGEEFVSTSRILSTERIFNIGDRVQFSSLADANLNNSYIVRARKFVENRFQTSKLNQAILTR